MSEKKKKLFKKAEQVIVKNKLVFVEDVVAYLGIHKSTFYDYFPIDSNESDYIKELLETNKIELKVSMRSKWYKSNAPALQMGLYKLLATDEEARRLSMQYNDHTIKSEPLPITFVELERPKGENQLKERLKQKKLKK